MNNLSYLCQLGGQQQEQAALSAIKPLGPAGGSHGTGKCCSASKGNEKALESVTSGQLRYLLLQKGYLFKEKGITAFRNQNIS